MAYRQLITCNHQNCLTKVNIRILTGNFQNETAVGLHVYRKGPPLGVGWVMQGWGGSCRDGLDHTGVGWIIQGWGGSYKGGVGHKGVGHARVGWVMQGGGQVGHTKAGWGGS